MSSILDDPLEHTRNPLFSQHEPSDYSVFYFTLTACAILALFLLILNVYLCCFSEHSDYWQDSNTGNRWLLPIWIKTPANQTPLDLSEFEYRIQPASKQSKQSQYFELQKKESAL